MFFSNGPVGRVDGNVDGKVVFVSSIYSFTLLEVGKLIDKMLVFFFGVFLGQKVRVSEEFQFGYCRQRQGGSKRFYDLEVE